jgi:hypothetical protein
MHWGRQGGGGGKSVGSRRYAMVCTLGTQNIYNGNKASGHFLHLKGWEDRVLIKYIKINRKSVRLILNKLNLLQPLLVMRVNYIKHKK